MYNFISIIFLVIALAQLGKIEAVYFITLCIVSIGFAIAGAIGSIGARLENLFFNGMRIEKELDNDKTISVTVKKIRITENKIDE